MENDECLQVETGGVVVQNLAALLADDHHVFQADAAPIGQVDARLDGDHHAGLQLFTAARRQSRLLMDRNAYTMAQAMAKGVAVSGVDQHLTRSPVNRNPGDTCADGLDAGEHGLAYQPVALDEDLVRFTGNKGPGHVGAVSLVDQAHVDQHQVARLQLTVRGHGVRPGGVGAKGNDGIEARTFCTHLPHGQIQSQGDLALGHARFDGVVYRLKDLLVQPGGLAQQIPTRVRPSPPASFRSEPLSARSVQAPFFGHVGKPEKGRMEEIVALKGQGMKTECCAQFFQELQQPLGIHFHLEERGLGLGLKGEPGIGEEKGSTIGGDKEKSRASPGYRGQERCSC